MSEAPALTCAVCGAPAIGVGSSALGAASFAYCAPCMAAGRDPWVMVVALVWTCPDPDGLADWAREIVEASLAFYGKTWGDLRAEVAVLDAEYAAYLTHEAGEELADA